MDLIDYRYLSAQMMTKEFIFHTDLPEKSGMKHE